MALEYLNMTGRRVLLFITIFLFISFRSFSAVFTVTSNADSGPGTLREALTLAAANGSATKDYIYFNLPDLSEVGRTISVLTQLPDVSSNLAIDGTTQLGSSFGVTHTKVKVRSFYIPGSNQYTFGGKNIDELEIYGIWLNGDADAFSFNDYGNITIGAASKGNYVETAYIGFNKGKTLTFQDNICWSSLDGQQVYNGGMDINSCDKITIGGSASTGNMIGGFMQIVIDNPVNNDFNISYNKMGTNIEGTTAPAGVLQNPRINIYPSSLSTGTAKNTPVNGIISNNLLANIYQTAVLLVNAPSGNLTIQGNGINTNQAGTINLNTNNQGTATSGIAFSGGAKVLIGGTNTAQRNAIAYCSDAIVSTPTNGFIVSRNSIFCYNDHALFYSNRSGNPFIKIQTVSKTNVSGIATPGAIIELFIADCDCGPPAPKTYFGTTTADNAGNWVYNGPVNGSVIASATANTYTSTFSAPYGFLNLDDSNPVKMLPGCNMSNGSIKNIKITNLSGTNDTYSYTWTNENSIEVGHDLDLTGVPSGTYTLEVKGSGCGSAFSKPIRLQSLTINLDLSNLKTTNAGCNGSTGSITGITASNATHYQWINKINNQIASNSSDLRDVGPGTYQLTASNDFGCSEKSIEYTINTTRPTTYPVYPFSITNSCSGQNSGSITLTTDPLVKTMRWLDANGQPAGTDANPHGLKPGTYKVYFTDASGCETLYPHDFTVNEIDPLQIVANSETRTDDQCGLNTGSIKNIQVKGGTQPYTYLWLNVAGEHLVTSQDLTGVGAGDYTLQVQDAGGCGVMASRIYTVLNENSSIDAPVIAPLQLCAPGEALLSVSSPSAGNTYRLYDSQTSTQYQDEQTNGIFKIKANPNSTYYISKVSGQCESERTQAQITISLSAIDIPNAFTPNGDGKNDYWKINNAQNYPQAIVQIFTRYGQKVFESKGYSVPFDGTYNGTILPSGVYYYILNLGKSCNLLSGSLSIIR